MSQSPSGSSGEKYLPGTRGGFGALIRKPFVLWIVLILAFLAIWQFLADPPGGGQRGHAAESGVTALTWILPLAFFFLMFGWQRWMVRRVRLFNEEAAAALKLFAGADYAGAAARFADLVRRFPRPASVRTTAMFNLAMAQLRGGELQRALDGLAALDPVLARSNPALRPTAAAQIAAIYALRGDPAAADRWIAEARARAKKAANPQAVDGAIMLARSVNAIRREERDAAARELAAAWEGLEGTLVAAELRPFRVLRAFATVRAQGADLAAGATAAVAGARPGELDWMGAEWPEMRAFLEAATTTATPAR